MRSPFKSSSTEDQEKRSITKHLTKYYGPTLRLLIESTPIRQRNLLMLWRNLWSDPDRLWSDPDRKLDRKERRQECLRSDPDRKLENWNGGGSVLRLEQRLFAPIDIALLVFFRITFGLLMLWEVYTYIGAGRISRYWLDPVYNFPYPGFTWLAPLPGHGMYWLFVFMGFLAIFIMQGLWYRTSMTLFFLSFTYAFLLEQARYLNHFYLICLISFIMIFLPMNRAWSIDALRRPAIASRFVPAWTLWLLRFQIGVVYFYGGIAKINADWLRGEPIRMWLAKRTDFPVVGQFFTDEWMVYVIAYGGLLLDLLIVPLLLWRRTRLLALVAATGFHLTNAWLFSIGVFPWFMIAATLLFISPEWPSRILSRVCASGKQDEFRADATSSGFAGRSVLAALVVYMSLQCALPLRHWVYPGNPSWTEEGHRYSWRMKLRSKRGSALFTVRDRSGESTWVVHPDDYLESWQASKMVGRPEMILYFAQFLAEEKYKEGYTNVAVHADVWISLNGRPRQRLIDPEVDLVTQSVGVNPATWILPLSDYVISHTAKKDAPP